LSQGARVYRLKTYKDNTARFLSFLPGNRIKRFRTLFEAADTPLPDLQLFNVRHALAEVLNASGMGEVVDRYLRDLKDLDCLAEDGSTCFSALVSVGLLANYEVFG
jgi:hypothetical protein